MVLGAGRGGVVGGLNALRDGCTSLGVGHAQMSTGHQPGLCGPGNRPSLSSISPLTPAESRQVQHKGQQNPILIRTTNDQPHARQVCTGSQMDAHLGKPDTKDWGQGHQQEIRKSANRRSDAAMLNFDTACFKCAATLVPPGPGPPTSWAVVSWLSLKGQPPCHSTLKLQVAQDCWNLIPQGSLVHLRLRHYYFILPFYQGKCH